MNASGGCQTHEMYGLIVVFCIGKGVFDFGVVKNRAVGDGFVYFHEVLVDHAACADVEVAYFGVAHLPVGEADVFA